VRKSKIYEQISSYLKDAITGGKLKIGEAIYSEPELCKKFNVSRTSVRKAIRELVEENLLVSKQGLGTFVKGNGHGIIYNCICLVNHHTRKLQYDIADTFYMDGIFGVESEVTERKMDFQVFSGVLKSAEELVALKQHKVDGLVIDGLFLSYNKLSIDKFTQITPHIVVLNGNPDETSLPCIVPDFEDGFKQVLELLGKERVAKSLFLHENVSSVGRFLLAEFKRALKSCRCPKPTFVDYSENLSFDNFSDVDHYTLIFQALEKHLVSPPSCIIASHDHGAAKALRVLRQHNLSVPQDVEVIGFNNMKVSTMVTPQLSTVDINMRNGGRMAVKFLLELINGETNDRVRKLPVKLLKRESHKEGA
jgi:DNA-binding LacI/PurR family transcriptional regulator